MVHIRELTASDWPAVWRIMAPVFRRGDTYAVSTAITEDAARDLWLKATQAAFVAVDDADEVLGTYYIKPNHDGGGAHVCNCGYIVGERARGQGVASAMCAHSQREALARGFRAMQFNFVVSTNEGAVRLWQRHGFDIVGTLPAAFRHPDGRYADAFVMHKRLDE